MAKSPPDRPGRTLVPPPQHHFDEAAARGLAAVRTQPADQLEWLGAVRRGAAWEVAVLGKPLTIELEGGAVCDSTGRAVGPWWRVLTLHYLAVRGRPEPAAPSITFADSPGGRAYASIYQQRVIERLCRTAGRDESTLRAAAEALSGRVLTGAAGGDLAVEFTVYPRVRVHLVWYSGGGEMAPSATLLLPANIESFFCLEDIVVLSERLVSRLSGGRF